MQSTLHENAVATADGTKILVANLNTAGIQISGTFVGTITFEGTIGGDSWIAVQAINRSNGEVATTATAAGLYVVAVSGLGMFRARISTYVSGAITVKAVLVVGPVDMPIDIEVSSVLTAGVASIGTVGLDAGAESIGTVGLDAGLNSIGTVGLNAGVNNIGDMDILTIASGETHIGQVGSESATIIANPTVTAGAYSIGDCVGGVLTFANAARAAGYGGVIKNLTLVDDAGQDGQMELWLFDQTFTAPGDNAAWAATEADLHNLVAIITSVDGAWFATGTPSVNVVEVSQQYTCVATSLFGQLVTRTSVTFAATDDISVKLGLLQD